MIVNVSEAKTDLSKLINMAYHGEKIIIAKNNLPLVELVIYKPKKKRELGLLKGQIKIPDDFIDEDKQINEMFYEESVENGEWKSVSNIENELKRYQTIAKNTLKKDQRINIRLATKDLLGIQKKAIQEGLPYQTLISNVLHKYVTGQLKPVS